MTERNNSFQNEHLLPKVIINAKGSTITTNNIASGFQTDETPEDTQEMTEPMNNTVDEPVTEPMTSPPIMTFSGSERKVSRQPDPRTLEKTGVFRVPTRDQQSPLFKARVAVAAAVGALALTSGIILVNSSNNKDETGEQEVSSPTPSRDNIPQTTPNQGIQSRKTPVPTAEATTFVNEEQPAPEESAETEADTPSPSAKPTVQPIPKPVAKPRPVDIYENIPPAKPKKPKNSGGIIREVPF